jgi:RNA polymerase sigma factor (sigma-70 family)
MEIKVTDQRILSWIKSSDDRKITKALKNIYKINYSIILKYILNNNGNEDDCKDILQESIIILYEQIRNKDLALNCSLKTYIFSVSKNIWLKRIRADRKRSEISDPDQQGEWDDYEKSKKEITLNQIIDSLDEKCKKILLYFYFENLSMKEIMVKLNFRSQQAAKNKKCICLNRLRELIKKNNLFND